MSLNNNKDLLHRHQNICIWSLCFLLQNLFLIFKINLFLAVLTLRFYAQASSSCSEHGLHCSCNAQASHSIAFSCCRAQVQQLCRMGLVAPQQVGSSPTNERTHISCSGSQILNHWTTRKVSELKKKKILFLYAINKQFYILSIAIRQRSSEINF